MAVIITMCSFLLSLVIVGGVEVAPNGYMVQYLEDGVIEWVLVPTDKAVRCLFTS